MLFSSYGVRDVDLKIDFRLAPKGELRFPLRVGTVGVALSYSGFKGVKNLIGKKDLFGRPLKMTRMNLADALAVSAVLLMGEGAECCPLAVIQKAPVIWTQKTDCEEIQIPLKDDLYYPLFSK